MLLVRSEKMDPFRAMLTGSTILFRVVEAGDFEDTHGLPMDPEPGV
jgi:hypothetical protein